MTHAVDPNDPSAEAAAQHWADGYVGRRRIASDEAYDLMVQAWRARFAGAYPLAEQRTREAGQVLADLGMCGELAAEHLARISSTARRAVADEVERDRTFFAITNKFADEMPRWPEGEA